MIKLCGINKSLELGEESNNKEKGFGVPIISPSEKSHLDPFSLSSFSFYSDNTVFITTNGKAYMIGNNSGGKVIGTLPKKKITEFTKFEIPTFDNQQVRPISAVCGRMYTLYLVSFLSHPGKNGLYISYFSLKKEISLFLNTGRSNPIQIFGGKFKAAAIDTEGSIIHIPVSFDKSPSFQFNAIPLSQGEKAVSMACLTDFTFALGQSGKVYVANTMKGEDYISFGLVKSLKGQKVVEISGNFEHCFALTADGKVFGYGINNCGKIGLGDINSADDFVEIKS